MFSTYLSKDSACFRNRSVVTWKLRNVLGTKSQSSRIWADENIYISFVNTAHGRIRKLEVSKLPQYKMVVAVTLWICDNIWQRDDDVMDLFSIRICATVWNCGMRQTRAATSPAWGLRVWPSVAILQKSITIYPREDSFLIIFECNVLGGLGMSNVLFSFFFFLTHQKVQQHPSSNVHTAGGLIL